jgi:TPR repeat protein
MIGAKGVEPDTVKAASLLRTAAEQGNTSAQFKLGLNYQYGGGGLSKDKSEALNWYRKAATGMPDSPTLQTQIKQVSSWWSRVNAASGKRLVSIQLLASLQIRPAGHTKRD